MTDTVPSSARVLASPSDTGTDLRTNSAETRPRVAIATIAAVSIFLLAAAISVDVVRTGYGVKGDEATYVAMGLSAAYDHDLVYERRDLERFFGLYRTGPEGLFLKRGEQWHVRLRRAPPFVELTREPEPNPTRLYFGKALAYPLAAAPFVRIFGLNGFLVLHALIVIAVLACGYAFLAATSPPAPALTFTLAFIGASVVPVYGVFLTSDLFNFGLVFVAYFLWLYKEVEPAPAARFLSSYGSDLGAAALLGIASFSKLTNVLLIAPIVLLLWWRRRLWSGLLAAAVFALAMAALVGANGWISGEFNYQGGERKTFYGRFPFDRPDASWDQLGTSAATNDADTETVFDRAEIVNRFAHNVEYFLVGRHSGFIPYFFPGFVAIVLWLISGERNRAWRILTFASLLVSVLALLLFFPYSWNGGGGPPGNRYFLGLYAAVFFLTPPLASIIAPLIAWIGGALFTAPMLVNPFVTAKYTYLVFERGAARRLPVELTIANDLPVMLSTSPIRARIPYRTDPTMLLYFLDENAFPPEPSGMWVSGGRRADIIVRTEDPVGRLAVTAESPIRTTLTISMGSSTRTVPLEPHQRVMFDVPAHGVRGLRSFAYLLSVRSSDGFTPHLQEPNSEDMRNLGAQLNFRALPAQ